MKKNIVTRAFSYIIGLVILSLGVSLTIKSDLGAGAWDALNVGLAETVAFTVGTWVIIVGMILIVLNSIMLKKRPDLYALLTIFIVGSLIDFWLLFVLGNLGTNLFIGKIIIFIAGLLMLSIGISTYMQAKFAPVPIDNLMFAIQKRTGLSLMASKTIGEVSAMILAILFGGPIGIGTVFVTFLIGPLIQFFYPRFERIMNKVQYSKG